MAINCCFLELNEAVLI